MEFRTLSPNLVLGIVIVVKSDSRCGCGAAS